MRHLTIILTFILLLTSPALGQKKSRKVQNLEKQRQEVLRSLKKTEQELKSTQTKSKDVKNKIGLLKKQVDQRRQLISLISKEISTLQIEADSLVRRINFLNQEENAKKKAYAKTVKAMQKRQSSIDRLLFLLSANSFDEGTRRIIYMGSYARAHKKAADELCLLRDEVKRQKIALEATKASKQKSMQSKETESKKLLTEESILQKEAAKLGLQAQDLKRKASTQRQKANRLTRQIQQQIAYEIAEAERKAREAQARAEAARKAGRQVNKKDIRKAETKGGYAMNEEERNVSRSFSSKQGRMMKPCSAPGYIEVPYGKSRDKVNPRITRENGGVDIATSAGANAIAVMDGVVSKIFVSTDYNKTIILRHGNYLTVYANLSSVYVEQGSKVKTGQALGKISTNNKTILHFEVWKERSRQNPLSWINM